MWLLFPSENSVHKVIKALFVFVWMGGLVLSFWGVWGNVWFGSPVFINTLLSAFVLVLWCEQEKIRYHFFSFTVYHVSWNMLLLPSKRVRSGEPAVFHGTCVDPHSSVLVITSRVKCMPSLLAAHTPSRCPFHSSHPKVTFRWRLFLPCPGHSCVAASLSLALTPTFTCISLTSFLLLEWPILRLAPDLVPGFLFL